MTDANEREALQEEQARRAWGKVVGPRWAAVSNYAGHRVLDLGCSNGKYVQRLRSLGYFAVGADVLASPQWSGSDPYLVATAGDLPFHAHTFDTVLAFETLEHVRDVDRALAECRRVATRNLILSVPNCDTPPPLASAGLAFHHWTDGTHVNFFDAASLDAKLRESGYSDVLVTPILPTLPALPLLTSMGLPLRIAGAASRVISRLTVHEYCLSLLAVAAV